MSFPCITTIRQPYMYTFHFARLSFRYSSDITDDNVIYVCFFYVIHSQMPIAKTFTEKNYGAVA